MKNSLPRHYSTLILAGGFSAALGLLVILGWHSHSISLVKIHPSFIPMAYNTALAFFLAGLGILAEVFRKSAFTKLCGALVFSIGFLTLAEYLSGVGIGIDQLFMRDIFSINASNPGRMAPNTSLNFALAGFVLLLMGKSEKPTWYLIVLWNLGLIIATLGFIGIMGHITGFSGAYRWGGSGIIGMAEHTAFGFTVIGIGAVLFAWQANKADSTVSPEVRRIKFNSIETRFTLALSLLTILSVITIDLVAHTLVFENIRAERIKTVGRIADAKHAQLVMVLTRANERAQLFLSSLSAQCNAAKLDRECAAKLIESYLSFEKAQGATLHGKGGYSLAIGTSAARNGENTTFRTGQIAKFSGTGTGNNRSYFISVAEPSTGLQLQISYPSSNLQPVFDRPSELGESGETFLADGGGYFVTMARYPSTQGLDIPIHAHPMLACLGGKNTEVLDLDYRDAEIIHGFRLVPEFGSACIMAHIDQTEAFAPMVALENKLFMTISVFILLVFLIALYMAKQTVRPIKQLTITARTIADGDYTSRANVAGADEISELANSFNTMTGKLFAANAQLNQKVIELQEAEERYRKLFEEATDAIAFADAETGVFLDVNQSFADMFGWERKALIGKPQKVIHPDAGEAAVSGSFERHRSDRAGNVIETQSITKDGKILEVSIKATVIELNERKVVLGSIRDITAQKLAEQKLAASYRKLQLLSLHLDKVREDEQRRISREIHDEMGATLTALKMRIRWLASKLPSEMAQFTAEVEHIDKLVANTIHIMRHVVSQLMPTHLHDFEFTAAVERYVQDFQEHTRIECGLVFPEELTLDENQSFALFRILQESLNNVAKHAQATKVSILFIDRGHSLIMLVRDNGVGFDRNTHKDNSFGLLGISERALIVNGKARVSSKPGKGTQVMVKLPLAGK